MLTFFSHPRLQKYIRYLAAYLLLAVFFVAGLYIVENMRTNIMDISTILKMDPQYIYILYSWGSFLLYGPLIILTVILETYFNHAARDQKVLARGAKVLLIEAGVGLVSYLITWLAPFFKIPPTP